MGISTRVVILSAIASALLIIAWSDSTLLAACVGGLALGAALGGKPHPYIGATVTAMLVGRIVYRFFEATPDTQIHNPLTLAVLMVTLGYYVTYYTGLLTKARRISEAGAQSD
jgi:cytochrome b561